MYTFDISLSQTWFFGSKIQIFGKLLSARLFPVFSLCVSPRRSVLVEKLGGESSVLGLGTASLGFSFCREFSVAVPSEYFPFLNIADPPPFCDR